MVKPLGGFGFLLCIVWWFIVCYSLVVCVCLCLANAWWCGWFCDGGLWCDCCCLAICLRCLVWLLVALGSVF